MRVVRTAAALALAASLIGGVPATAAQQHEGGAAYLDWTGVSLSGQSALSQRITPQATPKNMFWAMSWYWYGEESGGYLGIQTEGSRQFGVGDIAIFSMWDAVESRPGPGNWCVEPEEEDGAHSCRMNISVVAGSTYEITLFPATDLGRDWWGAALAVNDAPSQIVGYIRTQGGNLWTSTASNFIQYFGSRLPCASVPAAGALFSTPYSTLGAGVGRFMFSRPQSHCANSRLDVETVSGATVANMRFGGPVPWSSRSEVLDYVSQVKTDSRFWTKDFGSNELKVYARGIVGIGKVEVRLNGREVAWVRAATSLDSRVNLRPDGLVRTLNSQQLVRGRNVIEVFVDGERVVRRIFTRR